MLKLKIQYFGNLIRISQFSCSVVSDSLWPHGLQHPRPPCPSPTPGVYSNSCPLSRWCHPAISSSVIPFSSSLQCYQELTNWNRPWRWERLKVGGEGDNSSWDGWMASPTQWTWVWVNPGSWRWTERPGVLQFMGSQRVGHDWATELNWTEPNIELWPPN